MDKILVGSTYFFKDFADFTSKDVDYVKLIENPRGFKNQYEVISKKEDVFVWRKMSADEFVEVTLKGRPIVLGKFLVPDFTSRINFTLKHLKQLKPLFDLLDDKHQYQKIIYDYYVQNNDFLLTDEQLQHAYEIYKKYR